MKFSLLDIYLLDIAYISKDIGAKLSETVPKSAVSSLGQVTLFLHLEYVLVIKLLSLGCCATGNHPSTKQAR